MNIVKIQGGLGNQFFQYAFAKALKEKFNDEVVLDIRLFERLDPQKQTSFFFTLDHFNTQFSRIGSKEFDKYTLKGSWIPKFARKYFKEEVLEECEKAGVYCPELLRKTRKNTFYEGFFQSQKYSAHIWDSIAQDLNLKEKLNDENLKLLEQIQALNSVSLHIRRGDYLSLPEFNVCTLEYYQKAITYINERVENPHYFIFSNDLAWVKEHFNAKNMSIVSCNQDKNYFDLELMKHCKHNIIANSTFSWWGAALNANKDKIIIAPKIWYRGDIRFDDILPQQWIKL
ncbi:hypothetical protein DMB95_01920 [Campylobacter sp. MIT 12-8780]|uniref:alpha-1,2-fucosyltransferase n=1 Tax=unclassified Campylobacter TaxID=2593542 RepID=UPI00115D7343|nr:MULTISPECIES: alpha-1,2-fucosyltransferase [unclassified Campylobacter]NDJ26781.1 alpha-1,2-fucosyltransferase [Campylobacter sp. MIT 19-121]TQR42396.1 hypothetical protein DMB95_01920 [Campylobacter sp. MIT 12-8780]